MDWRLVALAVAVLTSIAPSHQYVNIKRREFTSKRYAITATKTGYDFQCEPKCQNGGSCISQNLCQCTDEYRGGYCQYWTGVCDPRKLKFNGNYECNGDLEKLECELSCPEGMQFSAKPEPLYVCRYDQGYYVPTQPPPECIYYNTPQERTAGGERTCCSWSSAHYKTLAGKLFSFKSDCDYIMLKDKEGQYQVNTPKKSKQCGLPGYSCFEIALYINGKKYTLSTLNGRPVVRLGEKQIKVPCKLSGLKVELTSVGSVVAAFKDVKLHWDLMDTVEITTANWETSTGLCTVSGMSTDVVQFVGDNRVDYIDGICLENINDTSPCTAASTDKGKQLCGKLLLGEQFEPCRKVLDPSEFYQSCLWGMCECGAHCACRALTFYAKECTTRRVHLDNWRDAQTCGIECSGGKLYKNCGFEQRCSSGSGGQEVGSEVEECSEGCFCPKGLYLNSNNTCVPQELCDCTLRGKSYPAGTQLPDSCNTCECLFGEWKCTKKDCPGRCEAIGDPHYTTFDGVPYDFMGKCSYYLLKTDNLSIEAQNVPCSGAVSEVGSYWGPTPSCTKSVTIRSQSTVIKLKQSMEITINGQQATLPINVNGVYIRQASSLFVQVLIHDDVEVWWDGVSSVFIHVPPTLKGKTKGLCGTFSGNQKDDFLTPEGDIEEDVISFANKWRTGDACDTRNISQLEPCELNPHNRDKAQKLCAYLTGQIFSACHPVLNPKKYFSNCLYDMCACHKSAGECLCPIVAAYAKECIHKGVVVDWRGKVKECGLTCPRGQEFNPCTNSCKRSCDDIASEFKCNANCVEGCVCSSGHALDRRGRCVPVSQCPCIHKEYHYPPGHKEIRRSPQGFKLCSCMDGRWNCSQAQKEDFTKYPNNTDDESRLCSARRNMEYTHCEPSRPITCQNMNVRLEETQALCYGGCVCKKGYVLDSITGECVHPKDCPCHHAGRSYRDGETIRQNCNQCVCQSSKWQCSTNDCRSSCSAWGDTHIMTFDGKLIDFQGTCQYMLAKGGLSSSDVFSLVIEVVNCGSSGVTCAKSAVLSVGMGPQQEAVEFMDGQVLHIKGDNHSIVTREAGLFLFAEVSRLGIVVQWDKGTRILVSLDPRWKSRVKGLCGNFNDNKEDDLRNPSGGMSETVFHVFADSWKLSHYCPPTEAFSDSCDNHPERKAWSIEKCSLLKSDLFKPCHNHVAVGAYVRRCEIDTCACDNGGDCECLCTVLAQYAQDCNAKGVHISWRSQQLCPIECGLACSRYSPCMSTCPIETCEGLLEEKLSLELCRSEVCIEGCEFKPCPEGQIYSNLTEPECIPKSSCKPFCLKKDGKVYYEGDVTEQDDCHTCFCTRKKIVCNGAPCKKEPGDGSSYVADKIPECRPGWTNWFNTHHPDDKDASDFEPLPTNHSLPVGGNEVTAGVGMCLKENMTDIECRDALSHKPAKETLEDVECSLESGLRCEGICHDYELRTFCSCGEIDGSERKKMKIKIPPKGCQDQAARKVEDCDGYEECRETDSGVEWIAKHCDQGLMFNPESLKCESTRSVVLLRPDCADLIDNVIPVVPKEEDKGCLEGEVWDDCLLPCNGLCHHYKDVLHSKGICTSSPCYSGCRAKNREACPEGHSWRDARTCVPNSGCTCSIPSSTEILKPGEVKRVSECEVCQCLNNEYICSDTGECGQTTEEIPRMVEPPDNKTSPVILPPQVEEEITPPPPCHQSEFVPLLVNLPTSSFKASSMWEKYLPQYSKFNSKYDGWKPQYNKDGQYIQFDLGENDNIYGVKLKGIPSVNEFVTKYYVLYSMDGVSFKYVTFAGYPELFDGPSSSSNEKLVIFTTPVETRYVRIAPKSWFNGIGLKAEVMGCMEHTEAPSPPTITTVSHECKEGLSHGLQNDQLRASSSQLPLTPALIALDSPSSWSPLLSVSQEWLQFDLTGKRNLTGVATMGSGPDQTKADKYPSWVSVYTVAFSNDGLTWTVVGQHNHPTEFLGNKDNKEKKVNWFPQVIRARYVRIVPTKWQKKISLRAEVLGCYEPYPEIQVGKVYKAEGECCPGVEGPCICSSPSKWDGSQCVPRIQCPCIVGYFTYAVGSSFENEDCDMCTCALGGVSKCTPKVCPPCLNGEIRDKSKKCKCSCTRCPLGDVPCPNAGVCIPESSWCDDIVDCGEDEANCTKTEQTPECPVIKCPEGFKPEMVHEKVWSPFGSSTVWGKYMKQRMEEKSRHGGGFRSRYGGGYRSSYGNTKTWSYSKKDRYSHKESARQQNVCPQYKCVPIQGVIKVNQCPPRPECLPGFMLNIQRGDGCNTYSCVRQKLQNGQCNVTSRAFSTFDGSQYKADICNHIIARQKGIWEVREKKNCTYLGACNKELIISQDNNTIVFKDNLDILYNGYSFTAEQLQRVGSETDQFAVKQISDTYLIFASVYEFSIIWDTLGNVKITATGGLLGQVDGMCGFFDGNPANDKTKPDGSFAKTWATFINSWGEECDIKTCPIDLQAKAHKICLSLRSDPFLQCQHVERLVVQCTEFICSCLESNKTENDCKCSALLLASSECRSYDPSVDLSQWRLINNCQVECPEGLVYKECLGRACEPCCSDLMISNACPQTDQCFPGCFCPDGFVRNGPYCVKPSQCRDCLCEGYAGKRYVTFDKEDYIYEANCTHILSQSDQPSFTVYGTSKECDNGELCLKSITVVIPDHIIHVQCGGQTALFLVNIDGQMVSEGELNHPWIHIELTSGRSLLICLPLLEMDIEFFANGKGFSLKLPSTIYQSKTSGLCGSCNLNMTDDLTTSEGIVTTDIDVFGSSWLAKDQPKVIGVEESCRISDKVQECALPDPLNDPCLKLYNLDVFARCHAMVNPNPFVEECHLKLCNDEFTLCNYLEDYVRECQAEGICLDWRQAFGCEIFCPKGEEYSFCTVGCSLTCDNYKLYLSDPSKCKAPLRDGCVCPQDQVLKNKTCVEKKRCVACDDEGHYVGDSWDKDKCTKCHCTEGGRVECSTPACVPPQPCPLGSRQEILEASRSQCCPRYQCVEEDCKAAVEPECGYGQEIQVDSSPSGCQIFVCRCKSDCEDVKGEMEKVREPGMVATMDQSGCCPRVLVTCQKDTCPPPPPCPLHHEARPTPGACCPSFSCEIPEGKCIYAMDSIKDENSPKKIVLKNFGDSWKDGPCRSCTCKQSGPSCSDSVCGVPPSSENYVYTPKHINNKCCPIYVRTACRMDGKTYQVGEKWKSEEACKTYECKALSDTDLNIKETVEECRQECSPGWEYEKPEEGRCCGSCKQVACVFEGATHPPNASWSSADGCTNYTCTDHQFQVIIFPELCPNISQCREEDIFFDGCCKRCKSPPIPTANLQENCQAEQIPLDKTIRKISINTEMHGQCTNVNSIEGYAECYGPCSSDSYYNAKTGNMEKKCKCCQGIRFRPVNLRLDCADGYFFDKAIEVPTSCACVFNECKPLLK